MKWYSGRRRSWTRVFSKLVGSLGRCWAFVLASARSVSLWVNPEARVFMDAELMPAPRGVPCVVTVPSCAGYRPAGPGRRAFHFEPFGQTQMGHLAQTSA